MVVQNSIYIIIIYSNKYKQSVVSWCKKILKNKSYIEKKKNPKTSLCTDCFTFMKKKIKIKKTTFFFSIIMKLITEPARHFC